MTEPLAVPISEACRLIGCGRSKFYQLLNDKHIALIKLGRRSLVPMSALRAFIDAKIKEAA
jgi:excisionase family DNA binding protein